MTDGAPKRRWVVVLGGNAFVHPDRPLSAESQLVFARQALEPLSRLLQREPMELLLSHGNGPQVGHMLIRVEAAAGSSYPLPLDMCVAATQGELGYILQQTMQGLLAEAGVDRPVVGVLTQVVVDPADPAFAEPTKPVGPVLEPARARELSRAGHAVKRTGDGWRRVVASPEPVEVVELEVIRRLLAEQTVVIAGGGGGIPVVRQGHRLVGTGAVIDKDLAACLLADQLSADGLAILTGVPAVYREFGTPEARRIARLCATEARELLAAGHFPAGSMAPKITAALRFVTGNPARRAIICEPAALLEAIQGEAGTEVVA